MLLRNINRGALGRLEQLHLIVDVGLLEPRHHGARESVALLIAREAPLRYRSFMSEPLEQNGALIRLSESADARFRHFELNELSVPERTFRSRQPTATRSTISLSSFSLIPTI